MDEWSSTSDGRSVVMRLTANEIYDGVFKCKEIAYIPPGFFPRDLIFGAAFF